MNPPIDPNISSLINCLMIAIGALSACVVALFAWFRANFKSVETKLTDCEDDRQKLWAKIAEILSGGKASAETLSLRKTNDKYP